MAARAGPQSTRRSETSSDVCDQEGARTLSRRTSLYDRIRIALSFLSPLCPSTRTLAMVALVGVLVLLGTIYLATQHTVLLDVNGMVFSHRTHQRTAQGVLQEMRIALYPEDLLETPSEQEVMRGEPIRIRIARQADLVHDGSVTRVRTRALTVAGVISDTGVVIFPQDHLFLSDEPCTLDARLSPPDVPTWAGIHTVIAALRRPVRLSLRRAVLLSVQDGPIPVTFRTTARTVGEALYERGLVVYLGDRVFPSFDARITPGLRVLIRRSRPLVLDVGGISRMLRTRQKTVGELLAAEGVVLGAKDRVLPDLRTEIERDLSISVVRVHDEYYLEETPIPFAYRQEPNPNMEIDHRKIGQWGREGIRSRRIRVHYENGQEQYRTEEEEWLARQPLDQILHYGTKIVERQLETPEGTLTYWRKLRVLATSYNAPTAGKPLDHPAYAITRIGWRARKGIIAVDPRVIKLRQPLYVPGYGTGIAADTGSAIKWRHIDLCYDDDNLKLWYRWVDLYVLTPVPPAKDIRWIIPDMPVERR